jgi:divalent metal cation (Fe/Co/Zn/Cd) transporter
MTREENLYRRAYNLSLFTIFYNILEGLVSMAVGYNDETLTLFGFGVDSFIEVISGIGVAVMILRIKQNPDSRRNGFEVSALRVTGFAFYLLSIGLVAGIINSILNRNTPKTTFWGVIISVVSIAVMIWLMNAKRVTGRRLNSEPVIADSNCTKVCVYMSFMLLISSLIYELTGFAYADVIGAAGLVYFSLREGMEAFEKAKGKSCDCS